ncbi:MAG: crotonase/enoyl-CoA hydratase family protein [Gammaproteobacteria bacterium]|nr:crotonase/enoyl-CoA hydratase family protein [Gammaproteobacteria bacterium]MDH5302570.1 crotonase/enoyl-CoA hydratase family protein [Gammaproteobacteria bacterium]MDH5321049.1 crotonase/enoyl-CoA hydratase family protein [Gammaproteobacteria bacterium]
MSDSVMVTRDGPIAIVTLNRPEKHNAVDLQMFSDLAATGVSLDRDASVRVIILEGAGPSFCAGVDIGILRGQGDGIDASKMAPGTGTPANFFQHAAYIWREVRVPVICAMHGSVFGAGLQIAAAADIRYARPDCRLSIMEIRWGIIPDMAISQTLIGQVAPDRIKELAMTGRIISGEEAFTLGLVTALTADPAAAARQAAEQIADRSPDAIRAIKRLIDNSTQLSVADALQMEAQLQLELLAGANQSEAVRANLEKRRPEFVDAPH